MSGIGEKIIDEIIQGGLVKTDPTLCVLIWSPATHEQLEALVEQHIREMSAEDVMRIRWDEKGVEEK